MILLLRLLGVERWFSWEKRFVAVFEGIIFFR
jgi:hypothetical protein